MTVTAYKCMLCSKLSITGFLVSITSGSRLFSFGNDEKQDSLRLEICDKCLDQLPKVIRSALQ